jgi:hypothetical protein
MGRPRRKRCRIVTEEVELPDDAWTSIRASSDALRRRQREHQQASGGVAPVDVDELPEAAAQLLAQCNATPSELVAWLAAMPACDCASADIVSWPEAQAAAFDATPLGGRIAATRAALAQLHAGAVQPLIDSGRLVPPTGYTLERLLWARGAQLRDSPPPVALSTSVRLWCGLPLVHNNALDTYEVFVTAVLPLTTEAEAALLRLRLEHLQHGDGIAGVGCEQTELDDGRPGACVRAGPFVLRREGAETAAAAAAAAAAEGCVPPALLWCFACLAVEPGEEPAVTFDESDACIAFLQTVLDGLSQVGKRIFCAILC